MLAICSAIKDWSANFSWPPAKIFSLYLCLIRPKRSSSVSEGEISCSLELTSGRLYFLKLAVLRNADTKASLHFESCGKLGYSSRLTRSIKSKVLLLSEFLGCSNLIIQKSFFHVKLILFDF
uniref:Uncharacterized protein n=1 Tax=Coxiella burnetii TaxID=777 RepID=Q45941_COXBE|nr:unnamed protein product [Coxiella burnetii]